MADNILDQLKAFQESRDAARRTADEILRERDLLREVSRLAKSINIEFNETTRNIGNSATKLQIGEELQEKLKRSLQDRNAIERSLLNQLETRVKHESEISELSRIASLNNVDLNREYADRNALLMKELTLGTINNAQYAEQLNILNEMYVNTASQLNVRRELLNRTNSEINNTRVLLNSENKRLDRLETQNKLMEVGKGVLTNMGPLGDKIIGFRTITAGNLLVDILKKGYENFKAFDKASVDIRKNLGALPGQVNLIENNLKNVTIELMDVGATFDDVGKSINAITDEINGLVARDKDLLKTTTAIAKQFGISESTGAKFLKTLGGISGNSASSQRSMVGFAQKIAVAAGIPLGKLMEDVASASDDIRIYVGNSAVSLIKAAAAARMLGTDLNKAAATAEKLLQFESSIGSELKASALLGRNINFNYARQLAFNKDIIGANKEVLRIAKQVNFNQLNPIQQKAFADAAGKSVSELQDMFQQEKNIALIRSGTNEKAKKALEDYERMMKLKDEEAKNEGKLAEQDILKRANQERLNQLQNKFNQMMSELAQPAMELAEQLLDIAVVALPYVIGAIKLVIKTFELLTTSYIAKAIFQTKSWAELIKSLILPWRNISSFMSTTANLIFNINKSTNLTVSFANRLYKSLTFIPNILNSIITLFSKFTMIKSVVNIFNLIKNEIKLMMNILKPVTKLFSSFSAGAKSAGLIARLFGSFGKTIPIVGQILTVIQAIVKGFYMAKDIFKDFQEGNWGRAILKIFTFMPRLILGMFVDLVTDIMELFGFTDLASSIKNGMESITNDLFDILVNPFKSAWNWIMDNLGGKSPSKIGLSIVKGLVSVGGLILDAITAPFIKGYNFISKFIPGASELKMPSEILSDMTGDSKKTKDSITANSGESLLVQTIQSGNQQLIQKIDQLIGLMSNGGISVNLDGQLVSRTLATTAYKSGGFGQSTTRA